MNGVNNGLPSNLSNIINNIITILQQERLKRNTYQQSLNRCFQTKNLD